MTLIEAIHARQILDSRGNPTVEAEVLLTDGSFGRAAVPSGASTGAHEAWELRDGDKSVLGKCVKLSPMSTRRSLGFAGNEGTDQAGVDAAMLALDGTPIKESWARMRFLVSPLPTRTLPHKRRATTLSISGGAGARLLPAPMMNIINGGEHADNSVDVQEFMVMPLGFERFSDALRAGTEVFHNLKKVLSSKGYNTAV